ncbi:alpha/beta-Hydrolase [Glarea lozoyensis ATCC 20868]|uniref:Alpha/beta-Hydrolase n=1 Tax=Glarea lozoyensis (strain ATCC 20868 / MF5171) TaxID=1116229 RepID=S3DCR6_GLAL2|nr:alpha/beta-Hydrolase [Glarea lozoyensis ATCC 20868]EPE36202.1 alpha/beta-Hydrolase [Glarea lozoyensis ATCC 20868]
MSISKPIFVCIPGVSHPPIIYDPLKASLSLHGYTAILVSLPSIGASQPVYDFTDDVLAIRLAISRLVDAGTDVIVVIHGWSGVVGGEAVQGMSKAERARRGLRGGVVRLVFIMAWIVKEGFQGAPRGDVSSMLPYLQADTLSQTAVPIPSLAVQCLFNDMAPQQANFWTSQLLPQSLGVFWSKTTFAAWRHIPTTYVLCGQDQNVTVEYAEMMIQAAKDSGAHMIDRIERCEEAGHEVFLSRVSILARRLVLATENPQDLDVE